MRSLAASAWPTCRLPAASRYGRLGASLQPCSGLLHSRPMLAGTRLAGMPSVKSRQALRVAAAATASPAPGSAGAPEQDGPMHALTAAFPVFVLASAALGMHSPSYYAWFNQGGMTPVLGATMLGMGLTLKLEDFKHVLAAPGRIFAGFVLQHTIMPLMAFAISRLMGLPLAYAIGLCIVGCCPGSNASNVVAHLAKADVPLSAAMTTASTLGAVVATPLLTQLLLGTLVPVDAAGLLTSTLQVVLLPVLVGAALNSAFPQQVAALAPLSSLAAVAGISLICGSVVAQNAAAIAAAAPKLLAAVFALHAGGFFFGYTLSKALGMPERAARTNSIEVGMQNSALAAVLAGVHFAAYPLAAMPCAISACMHSVMGSLLAAVWRSHPACDEEQPAPAPAMMAMTDSSIDAEALAAAQKAAAEAAAKKAAAEAAAVEQAKKAAAAATLARIASERVAGDAPAAPAVVRASKAALPPTPFSLGSLAGGSGELGLSKQGGSGSALFADASGTAAAKVPDEQPSAAAAVAAYELSTEDYQAPALGLAAAVCGLYGGRQNTFWPSDLGGSGAASLFPHAIQQAAAPIVVAPTPAGNLSEPAVRPAAQQRGSTGGYQAAALDLAAAVGGLYGGRPAVSLPAPTAQPAAANPNAEDGTAVYFPRIAQEAPAPLVPASVAAINYSTAAVGLAAALGGLYGGQPAVSVAAGQLAAAGGSAEASTASLFPRAAQQAAAFNAEAHSTAELSLSAAVGGLYGGRPVVSLPTPVTQALTVTGAQYVGSTAGTQLPRAVQQAAGDELPAAVSALGASPATALASATEQLQGWGGRTQPTASAIIGDAAAAEAAAEASATVDVAPAVPQGAQKRQEAGVSKGLVSGLVRLWDRITGSAAAAPADEPAATKECAAPAGMAGSSLDHVSRRPVGGSGAVSFSVQGGSGAAGFGNSTGRLTAEMLLKAQASQPARSAAPMMAAAAPMPAADPTVTAPAAPKLLPLVPLKRAQPVLGTGGLVFRPTPPEPTLAELVARAAVAQAAAEAHAAGRRRGGSSGQLRFSVQGGSGSAGFGFPAQMPVADAAAADVRTAASGAPALTAAAEEEEKRPLLEVLLEVFTHPPPPQKPKPAELALTEVQLKRLLGAGDAPAAGERALLPAPLAILAFFGMSSLLGLAAMAVPAVEFFNSWEKKLRSTHRRHLAVSASSAAPSTLRRPAPPPSEPELLWWEMPPVERTSEEIAAALVEALIGKEPWWEAPPLPTAQPAHPSPPAAASRATAKASSRPGRSLLAALYRSLFGFELPGQNDDAEQRPAGLAGSTRVRRAVSGRGALAFSKQGGSGSASFWSALRAEAAPKPAPKPAAEAAPALEPLPAVTLAEALCQLQGWGGRTPPSLASLQAKAAAQAPAHSKGAAHSNSNGNGPAARQAAVAAVADALAPAVAAAAKQPLYGQSGAAAFSTRGGSGVASFGGNSALRKPTRG